MGKQLHLFVFASLPDESQFLYEKIAFLKEFFSFTSRPFLKGFFTKGSKQGHLSCFLFAKMMEKKNKKKTTKKHGVVHLFSE